MKDNNISLIKRVEAQEQECKDFGFYWQKADQLIEQIQSECKEIEEALQRQEIDHLQEEIGDLILAAISLAIFCQFDPEHTLNDSLQKFQKRYSALVELVQKEGLDNLHHQPNEILAKYWQIAKNKS